MTKTYKYWFYYLDGELYAYTDKKEYAKIFEEERDMTRFRKRKEEITRDELNFLARDYQSNYLEKFDIEAFDRENDEIFESFLVITGIERITITNASIQIQNEDLYKYCWDTPHGIFKTKIIKALEILQYNVLHRQITCATNTGEWPAEYDDNIKLKPDMIGIFCHYYGKTLRRK